MRTAGSILGLLVLAAQFVWPSHGNSQQAAQIGESSHYKIQFTDEFSRDDLTFVRFMGFDIVRLKDADFLGDSGKPMLPSKEIRIALASGMTVTNVRVLATTEAEIPGEFRIFPSQPPKKIGVSDEDMDFVEPDKEIYASGEPYPPRSAEFVGQTDLAGQGIAVIELHPLRYVPDDSTLILHTSITLLIEGVRGYECGDYLPRNVSEIGRQTYDQMIRKMVVNPEDVQLRTSPVGKGPSVLPDGQFEHVIITSDSYAPYFQPLVDWHKRRGLKDTVVSASWIYSNYAGTDTQQIRGFVVDAHSTWGTTYFLIGGEHETVPFSFRTYLEEAGNTPSDQYYSDFDDDWTHEAFLGRVSVGSISQVTTFVDKVLKYERDPPRTGYPVDVLLIGMDYDDETHGEEVKQEIDTSYIPSHFNVARVYDSHSGNHKDSVIHYLGTGRNLVNHAEHAGVDGMGTGYHNHGWLMSSADVDALTNNGQTSILVSTGCNANRMDYDDCVAEHFVIYNPDQAGVAFNGNTRLGLFCLGNPIGLSDALDRRWWAGLLSGNKYNLAQTLVHSKHDFSTVLPQEKHCEWTFNLLGEPEMPVWTDEPGTFAATHPYELPAGVSSFFPTHVQDSITLAPVESAYVCLWKGNEVYLTGYTDANGDVTLHPFPETEGLIYVTVTKHNYIPYEGQANAIFISPPDIAQLDSTYVPWAKISKNTVDQALLGIRMDNASGIDHLESIVVKSFIERAFSVEYVKLYAEQNGIKGLQVASDQLLAVYDTRWFYFDTNDTLKLSNIHYPLNPDSSLFYIAIDAYTDSVGAAPAYYDGQRLELIIEPARIELTSGTNPDSVYNRPDWTAPDPSATGFVPGNPPDGRYRLSFDTQAPQFDLHFCVPEEANCPGDTTLAQGDSIQICATNISSDIKGPITIVDSKKIFLLDLIRLELSDSTETESCPSCDTNWNVALKIPDLPNYAEYEGIDADTGQWMICAWAQDSVGNLDTTCIQHAPDLIWKIDTRKPVIDSVHFYMCHDENSDGTAQAGDSLRIVAWAFYNPEWEVDSMVADLRAYFPSQPSKQWQQLDDRQENNRLFGKTVMLEGEPLQMSADSPDNRVTVWAWDDACNRDTLQMALNTPVDLYPFVVDAAPDTQIVRARQPATYSAVVTLLYGPPPACTLTVIGTPLDDSVEFDPWIVIPTDTSVMTVHTTDTWGIYDMTISAAEVGKPKLERTTEAVLIVTPPETLWIYSSGQVDMKVTDPLGDSIGVDFNSIQQGATYAEHFTGSPDTVTIPRAFAGEYAITILRDAGASGGDVYSIGIRIDGSMSIDVAVGMPVPEPGEEDTYTYGCFAFLRGDANKDNITNIADVIFLVNYLYRSGEAPDPVDLGDVNCDTIVNVGDLVYLVNYLFRGGDPPCS